MSGLPPAALPLRLFSWNSRGLWVRSKRLRRAKCKYLLANAKRADVILLQETHVSKRLHASFDRWCRSNGFTCFVHHARVTRRDTVAPSGRVRLQCHISLGMAILARHPLVHKYEITHYQLTPHTNHCISINSRDSGASLSCIVNIYLDFQSHGKRAVELRLIHRCLSAHRWGTQTRGDILAGDFNFHTCTSDLWFLNPLAPLVPQPRKEAEPDRLPG